MSPETISFEQSLEKLKEIIEDLEGGNLPLKESLEEFQNGIDIIKQCHNELETAELKIETIIKKDGKIIMVPLTKK
ncbi:exodeoxyribonuclease VII small subunit [Candidatus Woesearchaeota archaeon]|nr:exodeoxyribonuclease VII small subunit [Candidatus Woesearchaeota archaeon]